MAPEAFALFDAVGTVAFAMSGAFKAAKHKLDILGVLVLGFTTAMGGGILRDAMLNLTPVAFASGWMALWSLLGCVAAGAWHSLAKPEKCPSEGWPFLVVDALGLAVFAVTGATIGTNAGLHAWSVIILASLTAVGGGAVRDMLVLEVPMVLKADFYATAALLGGATYVLLHGLGAGEGASGAGAFSATLVSRLAAIRWKWNLPRLPG